MQTAICLFIYLFIYFKHHNILFTLTLIENLCKQLFVSIYLSATRFCLSFICLDLIG